MNASRSKSTTEDFVRYDMRPAAGRQYQIVALRTIAEHGGRASVEEIRLAIKARHPDNKWDRRYPIGVLADHGIVREVAGTVVLVEELTNSQIASLLAALDERSVTAAGLQVEKSAQGPEGADKTLKVPTTPLPTTNVLPAS